MSLRETTFAVISVGIGLAASVILAEVGLRVLHGVDFEVRDMRPEPWGISGKGIAEYDSVLGYAPRPGATHTWAGGWTASIDAEGLRRNGSDESGYAPPNPTILGLGDSSAFGDEVEDHESWPAHLERRLGRRVLNAGVGGYGIDQAVPRAERLMARFRPAVVVLSFVSDDVTRCAYSFRHRWKPYFSLEGDELVLTEPPSKDEPLPESAWLVALGHTHLAKAVLGRVAPEIWHRTTYRRVHRQEREVAGLLVARLAEAARRNDVRLLIVGLVGADADLQHVPFLLARASSYNVEVLDLTPELARAATDPAERTVKFRPHLHPAPDTNDWIAQEIGAKIVALGWL